MIYMTTIRGNAPLFEKDGLAVAKPRRGDSGRLGAILSQWIDAEEAAKYMERIDAECQGRTEYGMAFYALRRDGEIVGVGGLSDPLPMIRPFAATEHPGELKALYLDDQARGKGLGSFFLHFLEDEARRQGRKELLVRSAEQFRETAFGFYRQAGYEDLGVILNSAGKPMELFRKLLD